MTILQIDFWTLLFFFSSNLFQLDIWKVRNQLCLLPKWKAEKKLVYDFKVSLARLWHGTLQRERKITLHTWSIKKSLWNGLLGGIQSGTSHGIDGTAPGRADTWPGQDGCWDHISGHWPILWELLSHAVWRRTDGVGSTYGHATGFISVKNSPMLSPSVTSAAVSLKLTETMGHRKKLKKTHPAGD